METIRFMKRADKLRNRVIIPKFVIDKFGRDFYMDVNLKDGSIKLIPINFKKKGE